MNTLGINGFNPYGSEKYVFCENTTKNFVVSREHLLLLGLKEHIKGEVAFDLPCFKPIETILCAGYDAVEFLYNNTRNELQSILGVRKGKCCGLINMLGVLILPLEYSNIICPINCNKPVYCVQRYSDHKWAAISIFGEEIVPFGRYCYMWGFDHNHCLVSTSPGKFSGRAIIDINGNVEVDPEKYIDIYNFRGKKIIRTIDKSQNTLVLSIETLTEIANSKIFINRKVKKTNDSTDNYPYNEPGWGSYDEYGGYNGYDDFTIDCAFDGDPEASWNID